jgi:hypothetical protein
VQRLLPAEQFQRLEQRRRDPATGDRHPDRAERVLRLQPEPVDERRRSAPRSPRSSTSTSASAFADASSTAPASPVSTLAAAVGVDVNAFSSTNRNRACRPTRTACSSAPAPAVRRDRGARAARPTARPESSPPWQERDHPGPELVTPGSIRMCAALIASHFFGSNGPRSSSPCGCRTPRHLVHGEDVTVVGDRPAEQGQVVSRPSGRKPRSMYSPRPEPLSRLDRPLVALAHHDRQVPEPRVRRCRRRCRSSALVQRDLRAACRRQQVLAAEHVGDPISASSTGFTSGYSGYRSPGRAT